MQQDSWPRSVVRRTLFQPRCFIDPKEELRPLLDLISLTYNRHTVTLNQAARAYAYQDMGEYFIGGIADITTSLVLRIINLDGIMGYHGVPQMPIFAYKAIGDEISVVEDTDTLVDKYCNSKTDSYPFDEFHGFVTRTLLIFVCAVGANILYQRNTAGAHSEEAVNGRPSALAWLSSVLGGTYAEDYSASGCTTTTVTIDLINTTSTRRDLQDKPVWSWVD